MRCDTIRLRKCDRIFTKLINIRQQWPIGPADRIPTLLVCHKNNNIRFSLHFITTT